MRCTRCGHPYSQHTLGAALKCATRIGYAWNEKKHTFEKTCPCLCPGYRGELPLPQYCPHDRLESDPHCLYCGVDLSADTHWRR